MRQTLFHFRWLLAIVVLAFVVRLYHFTYPLGDWHSWRQADTASVTREYTKHGIDLLHPTYHDLSNIPSGHDNVLGYRMVEFPIINAVQAAVIDVTHLPLVEFSRFTSILFSLTTLVSLYWLVKRYSGEKTALVTALVFAILPYSVYYSRVILPEPAMLATSTFALVAFQKWLDTKKFGWYASSLVALALSLLLKPFVGFLIPVWLVMIYVSGGLKAFFNPWLVVYGGLSLVPFGLWRNWIKQYPEGIPASSWLFNSNGIRLRPAWFRWLGWERFTILFCGYFGVLAIPFNLLKRHKDFFIYAAWWIGVVAYLIVIATGNVQHDYYQNLALPIVVISLARGLVILSELIEQKFKEKYWLYLIIPGLILAGTIYFAWHTHVGGYFNVNHFEYVHAGQAVDQLTPPDALVIAPAFGDTQFLFQTNRRGWPIGGEIDKKISLGAQYYVTTAMDDEANELLKKYTTVVQTKEYLILDLTKPLSTPAVKKS